ncbi:hypothetical protein RvY_01726 [Ramazzottius varieornatus]|uniref:AB hydrolase-1 domain-containing protein n=1 Tax=Ramazzottius varieornatus TaxID=947166 RepID=A0A1D1UNB2_RAMVA|nr:hypothetical protein RvY_01726 [Ramazzottius varieornatus]
MSRSSSRLLLRTITSSLQPSSSVLPRGFCLLSSARTSGNLSSLHYAGLLTQPAGLLNIRYQSSSAATLLDKNVSASTSKSKSSTAADDFPFPVKRVKFKTCKEVYQAQIQTGELRKPVDGIEVDVGYIDTGFPDNYGTSNYAGLFPTVLCLHGAAGSHKDMADVIRVLAARGARVLCPNFPGVGETPMDEDYVYKHTTIENNYFTLDFLSALGVRHVDLVVSFSCGCYTAVPLAVSTRFPIGGLAMLQIAGHRVYKALKPYWVLKTVVGAMKVPIVRKILNPVSLVIMKMTGWRHISGIDTPYIMGLVTTGVPFDSYQKVSKELPFHRIPLLLSYSQDDKFMDAHISQEYAEMVGIPKDDLTIYDEGGQIYQRGKMVTLEDDKYLRGIVFRKGGHYAQRREPSNSLLLQNVCHLFDFIMRKKAERRTDGERYMAEMAAQRARTKTLPPPNFQTLVQQR